MGFDVVGRAAKNQTGEYFRNSCWGWRPLWEYVAETCADILSQDQLEHGCFNDGQFIPAEQARAIAERLRDKIAAGHAARYALDRELYIKSLPNEPCDLCRGTGRRTDQVAIEMKMPEKSNPHRGGMGWCNGCDGKGTVRPFIENYPFDVQNVQEFAEFCEASGGFEIW